MPHPAVTFLTALWGGPKMPEGLFAQLWAKKGTKSRSFYPQHWMGVEAFTLTHQTSDVYVGCSALAKPLGSGVRGKAKDSAAIPGFWLDVDVGKAHAPDDTAALSIMHAILPPTLIVRSGGGFHAWWLFDEPWRFASEDEHYDAASLCAGWVEAHRSHAAFKLDSVGELARVLRLPGTTNHKYDPPAAVLIENATGDRYPRDALADHARGRSASRQAKLFESPALTELPGPDQYPLQKIRAMREADEFFDRRWCRKSRSGDGSDSAFDLAILGALYRAGMPADEAIAACIFSRAEYGSPESADKSQRLDYWQRTWHAATQASIAERADTEAKETERAIVTELRAITAEPHATITREDSDRRWDKLNKLLGAGVNGHPRVTGWVQYGTENERNVWLLTNGVRVDLGSFSKVMHQGSVRAGLAAVTNILRPRCKDATWNLALEAVMPLRVYENDPEQEPDARALEWVSRVIGENVLEKPEHINEAVKNRHPFYRDSRLWITQSYLGQQLRLQRIAPDVKDADLAPKLRSAGFERSQVNYEKEDGKRSTRSYWSVETDQIP